MSKPRKVETLSDAIREIISGVSSLNMLPEPVSCDEEDMGYISETDANVKHAIEHFNAAVDGLGKAMKQIDRANQQQTLPEELRPSRMKTYHEIRQAIRKEIT